MKLSVMVVILYYSVDLLSAQLRVDPIVQIEQGLVRGLLGENGSYSYFLGIPYGKVDIDNPFVAAKPAPKFQTDIFDADFGGTICPQTLKNTYVEDITMTPDCLVLNIYIPYEASETNLLPVLVWIHGGKFSSGSGYSYNPEYFIDKSVIVVTVNYRLGPYGFLCLDTPFISGNQGLRDQYLALEWLRDNIEAFGGNPNQVTIGGQGAGATSVLLHLYSSKEKLYKKAIVQSGTPLSDSYFAIADYSAAIKIAAYLEFETEDTDTAITFISKASYNDVTKAYEALNLTLGPCKEMSFSGIEHIITSYPLFLSNEEKIKGIQILIGHSNGESAKMVTRSDYFESNPFLERLRQNFNFINEHELEEAAAILKYFYIGDEDLSTDLLAELINFESDFEYNYPIYRSIKNLLKEKASPLYQYLFTYVSNSSATVSNHGDDLRFLFKSEHQMDEVDRLFIQRITTLWANFIKYGNPSSAPTDLLPIIWPQASGEKRPYLQLNNELEVKSSIYNDRMALWDFFYRLYGKYHKFVSNC